MSSRSATQELAKFLVKSSLPAQRQGLISQITRCFHEKDAVGEDGLLVSLFMQICDAESESSSTRYLEDLIISTASSCSALRCAAYICARRPDLWSAIFSKFFETVEQFLSCQQDAMTWIQQVRGNMPGFCSHGNIASEEQSTATDLQVLTATVERYLHFLKVVIDLSSHNVDSVSSVVLLYLLALFDSDVESIAVAAEEAVFTLLSSIFKDRTNSAALQMASTGSISSQEFSDLIWNRIRETNGGRSNVPARRSRLQLRLRWTALPPPWCPSQEVLGQDEYWKSLQDGLRTGFSEQRKTYLYILRLSVPLLEDDLRLEHMYFSRITKTISLEQYERYCAVFGTLVLTRYINQVEECLHDLDYLGSAQCLVHKSWLYALLEVAMGPLLQDSIRGFTCRWFTNLTYWSDSQGYNDLIKLLHNSYLPWVTQGHLYTSSLSTEGQTCVCGHGQSFAKFLTNLFANFRNNSAVGTSRHIIKTVLEFMVQKDHSLFAYAGAYMLLGLVCGLQTEPLQLQDQERQAVLKIMARGNTPGIVQDFYRAACKVIYNIISPSQAISQPEDILDFSGQKNTLSNPHSYLSSGGREDWLKRKDLSSLESSKTTGQPSDRSQPSVTKLVATILESRHNCLRGDGLSNSCDYLENGMLLGGDQTRPGVLHTALEAIWNEVEIQDYPKNVLVRLPDLFLHDMCLAAMAGEHPESRDLQSLVHEIIFELQRLAENRIYVFSPLAKALRLSMLRHATFARNFPIGDFLINFCNRPPLPKLEFLLEAAMIPLFKELPGTASGLQYEDYYGLPEGYGYACIYDIVNRVNLDPFVVRSIFDRLLDPWFHQPQDTPVMTKSKTTLQLQMMVLLVDQATEAISHGEMNRRELYFHKLLSILAVESLPRYRSLIECVILRLLAKDDQLRVDLLRILGEYDQSNPKCVTSLIRLAVISARLKDSAASYVQEVMTILSTMAASHKVMIRHEAQWCFPFMWDHAVIRHFTTVTDNPAFAALKDYIRGLEKYATPPPGRNLEPLDPGQDMTIWNLVQGPFLQLLPPEKEYAKLDDFEMIFTDESQMGGVPPARIPLGQSRVNPNISVGVNTHTRSVEQTRIGNSGSDTQVQVPIQTKGAAWQATALNDISLSDNRRSSPRTPLVLIASLIKNSYNLGGLCRAAEIFGAAALHVASLAVVSNKDFLSTSVTSERHLNIQESPLKINKGDAAKAPLDVQGLAETLVDLKGKGYKIVGIEQTDLSVLLGSEGATRLLTPDTNERPLNARNGTTGHDDKEHAQLERYTSMYANGKVALVLGSEKEGIPAWILKECDGCIEIPQVGVTRSLNVQTAAAVVMYEYTRLRKLKDQAA